MKEIWVWRCKLGTALILSLFVQLGSAQIKNILWITAEDLSPRFSFYGDSTVTTPHLDRLASRGVTYTRAFATYGVCAPSRHSIIMGMYPTTTGAGAMRTWKRTSAIADITDTALLNIPVYEATPPPEAKCFTEYLRAAGFYCTNNEKTDYQFRPPFTAWDENGTHAHWRNRPDPDMPFFSVFNFTITHESQIHNPPSPKRVDPADVNVPPFYPDTETVRKDIAHHYDNIITLDSLVGELLTQLENDGLVSETLIFFYGDHGDGLPRAKRWVYDSGIQVPLIVKYPDEHSAGTQNGQLVSFVDFAPTVLSLLGVQIPSHMHGEAFLGDQKAAQERDYIYAFRDRMDPAYETRRAVRDQRYKYIRNYRPDLPYLQSIPYRDRMLMMQEIIALAKQDKLDTNQWQFTSQTKPEEELYDTEQDPHEIHNLAGESTMDDILQRLRQAHENFQQRYEDLNLLPEKVLIKRLWPPDGLQPVTAKPTIRIKDQMIHLSCTTEGASIGYQLNEEGPWLLYTRPIPAADVHIIASRAIRLGWKPSAIVIR